jgi:phage/plasmid-like protein (TIGR03299 family)
MAYFGTTPWHRLGTALTDGQHLSVEAAMRAAKLDWKVLEEDITTASGIAIKSRKALIRGTRTKAVLGIVGRDYAVLQNHEAFSVLKPAVEQFGCTIEAAGALGRGDKVWMLAKLPEAMEPVPGDKVESYFLVSSGHNGYTPYVAKPTPIRVVCQNTLSAALSDRSCTVKLAHTRTDMEQFELVTILVSRLMDTMRKTSQSFAKLAATRFSAAQLEGYVRAVFSVPADTDLVDLPKRATFKVSSVLELAATGKGVEFAPQSAWAAYNAVTEFVDHVRSIGTKSERVLKAADKSALFGPAAQLKQRALSLALAAA